jgi:hypothetical protein
MKFGNIAQPLLICVAIEIATFGGYTFALGFHEGAGLGLMAS